MGTGLASAGTAEEDVDEEDERRTSAGHRRPARVAAATRRVEIMTFDLPAQRWVSWMRTWEVTGRETRWYEKGNQGFGKIQELSG